jgi:septal ring factor EnvC (AmiA/AmiB activator)
MTVSATVALIAWDDIGARQRLTESADSYAASQSQLGETRAELTETARQLTGARKSLRSTESALKTTKAALSVREHDLTGVRNDLNDAKSSLTIKSGQVETLKTCLNGVGIALRDYSTHDYAGVLSSLDAVKVSCNTASEWL